MERFRQVHPLVQPPLWDNRRQVPPPESGGHAKEPHSLNDLATSSPGHIMQDLTEENAFEDAGPLPDCQGSPGNAIEGEPASTPALAGPLKAAEAAKPLALSWIDNALAMLRASLRSSSGGSSPDLRGIIGLETVRRHFHTDRRAAAASEAAAIETVESNFRSMRRYLAASSSIFSSADDETAANNTRGYYGSGLIVAAYAYSQKSISFTNDFTGLGPRCKAAVIIHQLAHFLDARMRDHSRGGIIYDMAGFETALFNAQCYPNFAVNATPPYLDERFGLTRPEL